MTTLDLTGGIHKIHAVANERHEPHNRRHQACHCGDQEPHPTRPGCKPPRHEPVLDQNSEKKPAQGGQRDSQQKRRQGRSLQLGAGSGKTPGQVLLGF